MNGLTPFEELHGRYFREPLFRFGQPVLVRRPTATLQAKLEPRWTPSLWMGRRALSNEHQVAISRNVILAGRSCRALARDSEDYDITTRLWQERCDVRAERPTPKRAVDDEAPQGGHDRSMLRGVRTSRWDVVMAKTPITTAKRRTTAVDLQEEKKKVRPLEDEEKDDADETDEPHELRRRGSRRKRAEETAPWKVSCDDRRGSQQNDDEIYSKNKKAKYVEGAGSRVGAGRRWSASQRR